MIDGLIERRVPLIEKIDGDLLVLDPKLKTIQKVLLLLYQEHPKRLSLSQLQKWTGYKNSTDFKRLLENERKNARIHVNGEGIRLTRRGLENVEDEFLVSAVL